MTDQQLRKLTRLELIEILIAQDREIEELKEKLARAEEQVEVTSKLAGKILNTGRSSDPWKKTKS